MGNRFSDIKEKYKQFLPLLLLTILAFFTISKYVIGKFVQDDDNIFDLTLKHYFGFATLIINYLTYFYARQHYRIVVGITLLIGLFNVINFTVSQITTSIRIGSLEIGCQPYILLIGLLTYLMNRKSVNNLIRKLFGPTPKGANEMQEKFEIETIQKFKDKYQSYSNEQLENILTDKRYVSEALEASRQILEQRKTDK